jgi:hypothetical protein
MKTNYFIFGNLVGIIFILIFFGVDIKPKSKPRIKINIPPFVRDSHIIVGNKHLHHWFISLILFSIVFYLNNNYKLFYILEGFFFSLILQGLLYQDRFDFDVYTIEDLKWDKVPLNPMATLPINELEGTQSVPL